MIFEPELETLPRERLAELQLERLRGTIERVRRAVPLYRDRLAGLEPGDIPSLDDLGRIPFTRKDDLRDTYPLGMLAVEPSRLARIHASSGTTGKPTVVAYTAADLDLFGAVNARALAMGGARPGMMLHNAYGYGLFTGGLGLHGGGERLGLTVVPVSGGMTERQLTLLEDLRPEVIACTPSYALTLAHALAERGRGPDDVSVRFALLGAEPWTERMREEIDASLGVRCVNVYGLSEVVGPGVSCECVEERSGSHVNEDHFLPEIVDPESGVPLPEGTEGVLVLTTLTKEALPVLRYWTGDICSLRSEPCSCGRTLVRMGPIVGRSDDMLIVRGVNVFPSQVGAVLGRLPELSPHFGLVVRRLGTLDEVEVLAEVTPEVVPSLNDDRARELSERTAALIRDTIGCSMTVTLVEPGKAPRSDGGKIQRVQDLR
ncbi:MAG TPA: phenylacetate--CoA ligase [Gaiellaceae bacterium]|nr:phenylacetate--CoA ligase [Gaiellaceae bacterium]